MNRQTTKLVEKARQGDKPAMKALVEGMRMRLHEYVNRLTLDRDLTDEIVQDSLVTMMEQLPSLRQPDQLWPWLSRIAINRMHRHYRENGKRSTKSQERLQALNTGSEEHNVVADAITQELRQIVLGTMRQLKPEFRTALVLRCYEQLSFPEIAERMGSTEFKARALFVRAKRALGKNLTQNGFGRSSLLGALLVFGKMTATSEASLTGVSVSNATLWAGCLPALSVALNGKLALVAVTAVGGASVIGAAVLPETRPGQENTPMAYVQDAGQSINQAHQHWYYYPPGSPGTVHIQVRAGVDSRAGYPILLQNEHANYARTDRDVLICNAHVWHQDGSVMRLPTDKPSLSEFLNKMEGTSVSANSVSLGRAGLLVIKEDQKPWHVLPDFDLADERCYRGQWPEHLEIVDQRDAIHKRGWTYVEITGTLREGKISGSACFPLVYAQSKEHSPWLRLKIGNKLALEDNGMEAVVKNARGQFRKRYQGGSFFQGLARPWQGLHTIDTVRRDAAQRGITFKTNFTAESDYAIVHVDCGSVQLTYRILMQNDLIREIAFSLSDGSEGQMRFAYPPELSDTSQAFARPSTSARHRSRHRNPGMTWLAELADGTLGQ